MMPRASLRAAALAVLFSACVAPVRSWGRDGHMIIGEIAKGLLSTEEQTWAQHILGRSEELARAATWADEVRSKAAYHWSAALHFINVEDHKCNFIWDRDCHDRDGVAGNCAAGAIVNYTQRFIHASAEPVVTVDEPTHLSAKNEALRFVLHFMGDIHQPLHVSWVSDRGGNDIDVEEGFADDRQMNLHAVWDTGIIEKIEKLHGYEWEGYAANLSKVVQEGGAWAESAKKWARCLSNNAASDLKACLSEIATESIGYACSSAYKDDHGQFVTKEEDLDEEYFDTRAPIVDQRLAQGGVRLAALIKYMKTATSESPPVVIV